MKKFKYNTVRNAWRYFRQQFAPQQWAGMFCEALVRRRAVLGRFFLGRMFFVKCVGP